MSDTIIDEETKGPTDSNNIPFLLRLIQVYLFRHNNNITRPIVNFKFQFAGLD